MKKEKPATALWALTDDERRPVRLIRYALSLVAKDAQKALDAVDAVYRHDYQGHREQALQAITELNERLTVLWTSIEALRSLDTSPPRR
jgi:hypothetical protein